MVEYVDVGTHPKTLSLGEGRGEVKVVKGNRGRVDCCGYLYIFKAFVIQNASSSKAPMLTEIDTTAGQRIVEEQRAREGR